MLAQAEALKEKAQGDSELREELFEGAIMAATSQGARSFKQARELRARYQVKPRDLVPFRIRATGESTALLEPCRELIAGATTAESVEIGADVTKTADAATAVLRDIEIYALGVVDPEAEAKKIAKQVEKLTKQVDQLEKKLGNKGFVDNAPPEVVEKERATLAELQQQLRSLGGEGS